MQSLIKPAQVRIQGRAFFVQEEKFLDQMNDCQFVTWNSLHIVSGEDICADSNLPLPVKKRNKPAKSAINPQDKIPKTITCTMA